MRYRTIVADPPWRYDGWTIGRGEGKGRHKLIPYNTMTVAEIAALPVAGIAEDNAHLYLWTTNKYLPEAFGVAEAWGFKYSTPLIWAKTPMATMIGGAYRPSAEFCLFCRRGKLDTKYREITQWWNWPRSNTHSRKPDAFMDLVEAMSPGPYVELFSRRQRIGWDVWGDEVDTDVEMPA